MFIHIWTDKNYCTVVQVQKIYKEVKLLRVLCNGYLIEVDIYWEEICFGI